VSSLDPADAHPHPAVQITGLYAGRIYLHVCVQLFSEDVTVVRCHYDGLAAEVGEQLYGPREHREYLVHALASGRNVADLALLVHLLGSDGHQVRLVHRYLQLLGRGEEKEIP
jgi:hypothetical protein